MLAIAELQSKQLGKLSTKVEVLVDLLKVQKLIAQFFLLDNPFGIDGMHLTGTAQVIEQTLAAMKQHNAAGVAKDSDALQKMDVAQEPLPATRLPESPELVIRTKQVEATISANDTEIA